MGRANQFVAESGGIFHITHRCHNRAFLLKFARDRDTYRAMLRKQLLRFKVWLLDYCLTSNHVHLLIDAEDRLEVSALIRNVAGEFARAYNRLKKRMNVLGRQFSRDAGGGRAVSVAVPLLQESEWLGYHEILGHRRRYRLLDVERLCWRLGTDDLARGAAEFGSDAGRGDSTRLGEAGTHLDGEPSDRKWGICGKDQTIAAVTKGD